MSQTWGEVDATLSQIGGHAGPRVHDVTIDADVGELRSGVPDALRATGTVFASRNCGPATTSFERTSASSGSPCSTSTTQLPTVDSGRSSQHIAGVSDASTCWSRGRISTTDIRLRRVFVVRYSRSASVERR